MRSDIATRLKAIRKSYNRTQAQMAERLNVSTRAYAAWERGESDMATDSLGYYAGMGWNMNWLLTGVGPERLDAEGEQAALERGLEFTRQWRAELEARRESPEQQASHSVRPEDVSLAVQLLQEAEEAAGTPAQWTAKEQGEATAILARLLAIGVAEADVREIAERQNKAFSGGKRDAGPRTEAAGQ